jgi:hypothetical protein
LIYFFKSQKTGFHQFAPYDDDFQENMGFYWNSYLGKIIEDSRITSIHYEPITAVGELIYDWRKGERLHKIMMGIVFKCIYTGEFVYGTSYTVYPDVILKHYYNGPSILCERK